MKDELEGSVPPINGNENEESEKNYRDAKAHELRLLASDLGFQEPEMGWNIRAPIQPAQSDVLYDSITEKITDWASACTAETQEPSTSEGYMLAIGRQISLAAILIQAGRFEDAEHELVEAIQAADNYGFHEIGDRIDKLLD